MRRPSGSACAPARPGRSATRAPSRRVACRQVAAARRRRDRSGAGRRAGARGSLSRQLDRALIAATLALAIFVAWGISSAELPSTRSARPDTGPAVLGLATPLPAAVDRRAAAPRHLEIPAIGVSSRFEALGLHRDGTLETPRRWQEVGWYKPGPEPGERGPAVVAGHVDSKTGPAVFYRLHWLRRGDLIRISRADRGHTVARFRVQRVER